MAVNQWVNALSSSWYTWELNPYSIRLASAPYVRLLAEHFYHESGISSLLWLGCCGRVISFMITRTEGVMTRLIHWLLDDVLQKTPLERLKRFCRYVLNYCISPTHPCLIYWTCVNCKQYGNLLSSPSERGKIFPPPRFEPGTIHSKWLRTDALDHSATVPALLPVSLVLCTT